MEAASGGVTVAASGTLRPPLASTGRRPTPGPSIISLLLVGRRPFRSGGSPGRGGGGEGDRPLWGAGRRRGGEGPGGSRGRAEGSGISARLAGEGIPRPSTRRGAGRSGPHARQSAPCVAHRAVTWVPPPTATGRGACQLALVGHWQGLRQGRGEPRCKLDLGAGGGAAATDRASAAHNECLGRGYCCSQ